jgi:anaerobic ribonucleoside-triphosphate reductase activating protein
VTGLAVHAFLPVSRANGPGRRAVLWVRGCSLACPGCFNPETHAFTRVRTPVDDVFGRVAAAAEAHVLDGLTVSGGEPFQQRRALAALLGRVRAETDLSVLVFTGYTTGELASMPGAAGVLRHTDVLVAGRYDARRRLATGLRGSANKTVVCLTDRYTEADVDAVPLAEVVIGPDGDVVLTGIDPVSPHHA